MNKSAFRQSLEDAVNERHCADHPMWDELAAGDLGRNACMGWAVEHYHWLSNMLTEATFQICAKAPNDVIELELENFHEEEDPDEGDFRLAMQNALDRLPEEKIMEILEEFGFGADEYHWGNK